MQTPARLRFVLGLSAAALVLGSCGIEASETNASGPIAPTTTVDCSASDDGGSGTGGTVGSGDIDPACTDAPTPPTEPDPEPDPEPTTTTEPPEPDVDVAAYEDAMVQSLFSSEELGLPVDEDQAVCIGPQWVESIGAENMADFGLEPEDLIDGDVSDAFEELIDLPVAQDMVQTLNDCEVDVTGALVDDIASDAGLTDEQAACFADELPDGFIEEILAISLADGRDALDADPDLAEPISDAALACR